MIEQNTEIFVVIEEGGKDDIKYKSVEGDMISKKEAK